MSTTPELASQIYTHLSSKSLPPTQQWLKTFLSTQRTNLPIAALKQTALFRLLASDITTSLQHTPTSIFPSDILSASIAERTVAGPIPVQVLDIEDIGRSRWSQIEAIDASERGESTKGREVIRVVEGEEGLQGPEGVADGGPWKVLVQDAKGARVYGFELKTVDGVGAGMSIGAKMVLRNAVVTRGVLLLEPASANVVGGKIDLLHKAWKYGRKAALKRALGAPEDG